jgi:pSer/pThr/pTyr-binding forkhead associated (FHA) protein
VTTSSSTFEWNSSEVQFRAGRGDQCALRFQGDAAAFVSWDHADFALLADGLLHVTDLKSSNGTYVDGERIAAPTLLSVGSIVQMGQTGPRLEVLELGPVVPAVAAPAHGSPIPVAVPVEVASTVTPTQESVSSSSRRTRSKSSGTGKFVLLVQFWCWIIGAVIGLGLGYYVLCVMYPHRYKWSDVPLPWIIENDASQVPAKATDAEAF